MISAILDRRPHTQVEPYVLSAILCMLVVSKIGARSVKDQTKKWGPLVIV